MKTVKVETQTKNLSLEKAWELITDIEKYPQRVRYVKKVKVRGAGVGSQWEDLTTILWIPIKMQHTITSFKKNKEYGFTIPLSFGGIMKQNYIISKEKQNAVTIKGSITYDLGNKFLNNTIGSILNRRLKKMLLTSIRNIDREVL